MYNNSHKLHALNKHCPECRVGRLSIIQYDYHIDGVDSNETYEECDQCDYSVKVRVKRKEQEPVEKGW